MRTIVVATDGSKAASAALGEAIAVAQGTGDTIAVVTVWRALQGDFGLAYPSAALLNELLDAERTHAEQTLADARARCEAAGVPVETRLATGDPAECICTYAAERDTRMIGMGTHGYGSVMSLLVGSVSGAVIRRATCPVLVVRDPDETSEPRHGGLLRTASGDAARRR
jgi:nucleotide-binding universal stress UspA family protein